MVKRLKKILIIRKVVVPAAGLGTRLFQATKEQPKAKANLQINC